MPEKIPAIKTPSSAKDVVYALASAWLRLIDDQPRLRSLQVLVAQWALETGWGTSMWCYNLGNAKHVAGDGRDWCYFNCGEELLASEADALRAADPGRVSIVRRYVAKGRNMASVRFLGEHPYNAFRAYRSLAAGAIDYLAMIHKRFDASWPAVIAGDPGAFSHAIKSQGYYTADEASYTKVLASCHRSVLREVPGPLAWELIPFEMDDQMRARLDNLLIMNCDTAAREYLAIPSHRKTRAIDLSGETQE